MLFPLAGLVLVALFALLVREACRVLGLGRPASPAGGWCAALLAAATLLLLGRPDEQIEGGEDPGVYFNVAQALVARGAFSFQDPGLHLLPPPERKLFRYGNPAFLMTKDAVFWAKDADMDRVGVFFQPAYSVLLAAPVGLGFSYGVFALTALVAVGCGLLVAGMSRKVLEVPWAAGVAYAMFLLHPAVAWNGRALRAEWPAALLVLAGLVLWISRVTGEGRPMLRRGLGAGLAMSGALLFHMTAVYVLGPVLLLSGVRTRKDRFWAGWWVGAALGLGLFAAQTVWVTDPYWIGQTLGDPSRRKLVCMGAAGGLLVAGLARLLPQRPTRVWQRGAVVVSVLAMGVAVGLMFVRDDHGRIPGLPAWTASYLSLTDFRGVSRMMGLPGFALALLGLPWLAGRTLWGRWLFVLLTPASFTIGWVVNYMFETRRMVAFLVPLLTLSALSLLRAGTRRWRWAWAAPLAAALPVLQGVAGAWPVYRVWNLEGTHGFYRHAAQRLKEAGAEVLFAEYTQTAVPLEGFSRLPMLPFAWDYRSDAEREEAAAVLAGLVGRAPSARHVWVAPFAGALIPGLAIEPLFEMELRTKRLDRARRAVPRGVGRRTRTLYASRLLPPGETAPRRPHVREFPGSRFGLRGAGNRIGARRVEYDGRELSTPLPLEGPASYWVFLATPYGGMPRDQDLAGCGGGLTALGGRWTLLRTEAGEDGCEIPAIPGTFVAHVFREQGGRMEPLPSLPGVTRFGLEDQDAQWLSPDASLALPLHPGGSWLWLLASHGRDDGPQRMRLLGEDGLTRGRVDLPAGWHWVPLRLDSPGEARGEARWLRFRAPPDTPGFRLARLVLLPDSTP